MSRKKLILIAALAALVGYIAYQYWKSQSSGSPTGSLGTNLNSVAPELVGGSTGPNSGLNYYGGNTTINVTEAANAGNSVPVSTTITPPKVIPAAASQ